MICRAMTKASLLWQWLVADRDQADPDVEAGQAGGIEVLTENSEVGSGVRSGRVDQYLVTPDGDTDHRPARVVGPVLGHRLYAALPDRGLVDPVRVAPQRNEHRPEQQDDDDDAGGTAERRRGRLAGDLSDPVQGHHHDAAGQD